MVSREQFQKIVELGESIKAKCPNAFASIELFMVAKAYGKQIGADIAENTDELYNALEKIEKGKED